jgi:Trk K+ transport system NAD-binding subunit
MRRATFAERVRYRFDNTLSRGPLALVGWLALATATIIVLAVVIDLALGGIAPAQGLGPRQIIWSFVFQTLTPNPPGLDGPWQFLAVMLMLTIISLLGVSLLIGLMSSTIADRVDGLRRGRSRVIESGHTVILGWSSQVFTIVAELAFANRHLRKSAEGNSERRNACVVVLAGKDKVEMEEEIHTKVPDMLGTRVVCRTGSPLDLDDLQIASPDTARAIIVVSPGGETPDLPVVKAMIALAQDREQRANRYHVVAAIHRPANLDVARMIGGQEADVFMVDRLVSAVIAQTCRQPGLSTVYAELLSFAGAAIYSREEPALVGMTYGAALSRFRDSALMGLRYRDGRVQLNPAMDTIIQTGDQVIAIAESAPAIRLAEGIAPVVDQDAIRAGQSSTTPVERLLVLGWNRRGPMVLDQISYYAPPGSQVHVVAPYSTQQMQADCSPTPLEKLNVTFEAGNYADRPTLERLAAGGYPYVVILSRTDIPDIQVADAHAMLALFHLRDIMAKTSRSVSIVSEILDVRNRDLSEVSRAEDVIISERLVALALAQIAENRDALPVFVDLLNPGGVEIYLKPAVDYVLPGRPVEFYTIVEAALRKGETAIGYRLLSEAGDAARAFGVHLNPDKLAAITFAGDDRVIVLAES